MKPIPIAWDGNDLARGDCFGSGSELRQFLNKREAGMRNLFNVVMRIVSTLVGILMVFMGSVWAMQGLGVGPQPIMRGFMVNDLHWTVYGVILALFGVGQIIWSNTRQTAA
jgi:hypothetical protein